MDEQHVDQRVNGRGRAHDYRLYYLGPDGHIERGVDPKFHNDAPRLRQNRRSSERRRAVARQTDGAPVSARQISSGLAPGAL